jgi:hypothetical protein
MNNKLLESKISSFIIYFDCITNVHKSINLLLRYFKMMFEYTFKETNFLMGKVDNI